jgi:hypothetical protein
MGKKESANPVSRREILKLAGTAAAFCTSFGFLHGGQTGGVAQNKNIKIDRAFQLKWEQAEMKWYSGNTLLHSSILPAKVAKFLGSDMNATVEIKIFRAGQMFKNLGILEAKH